MKLGDYAINRLHKGLGTLGQLFSCQIGSSRYLFVGISEEQLVMICSLDLFI